MQDVVSITAYNARNLCESSYTLGTINDPNIVQEGKDELTYSKVLPNTQYTISNIYGIEGNIVFFFDKDYKFINSTNEKTFVTPQNASYLKVITTITPEHELNGFETKYCLVLGDKEGDTYDIRKTEVGIDVNNQENVYFPLDQDKLVIYVEGGDIEVKYVKNR